MRSLGERITKLRNLLNLRCGPGAAILPPEVTRIHMEFAHTMQNGHMGPKKFWTEYLPRLKFHNPSIPMIINRHKQNENKPIMTIYFRDAQPNGEAPTLVQPPSSFANLSPAQPPAAGERTITIDMHEKQSAQILEFFMAETRAVPLKPTPEETQEMKTLGELRKRSEVDRARVGLIKGRKVREQELLQRARAMSQVADDD